MTNDPTIREQSYRYFLQEAPELLQVLEQELLSLREDYSINKVHNLMRTTHTLKGAAASIGLETIKTVAHSLEDIFKALFNPELSIDAEVEALLFEGYECLRLPLTAELTGGQVNDAEILDRTTAIFTQLQEKLGNCFAEDAHIPNSVELGFDVIQSIFEVGVTQRLDEIAAVIALGDLQAVAITLRTQCEIFQGLAESLNLSGFEAIAQAAIAALDAHPDQVLRIAQTALADFQAGQAAVLNGDRTQGGQPSLDLQQLAGFTSDAIAQGAVPEAIGLSTMPETSELQDTLDGETQDLGTQPELDWVTHTSDLNLSVIDSHNDESVNPLLELIWGGAGIPEFQTFEQDSLASADPISATPHPEEKVSLTDREASTPAESVGAKASLQTSSAEPVSVSRSGANTDSDNAPIATTEASEPTTIPQKEQVSVSQTVRIEVEHLDHLNYSIGELLTNQNHQSLQNEQLQTAVRSLLTRLEQHQQLLGQLQDWSDHLSVVSEKQQIEQWGISKASFYPNHPIQNPASPLISGAAKIQNRFDSLELDHYSESQILVQLLLEDAVQLSEAAEAVDLFAHQSNQTLEKQRRLLTSTRDALMEARMLPLGEIFSRFPRVLQQLEALHNKPVGLELGGTEVLVDKVVAEKLYAPLLHLVRNAFAHGIESPTVRQQQGKPKIGQIEISAYHQGKFLVIEVRDDGQGLDFEAIRQRAVECQLVSPEQAARLNEVQLTNFLFEAGFSTTSQVNDLSGRGIGLDLVRAQLQALQGSVTVDSEPNGGTRFVLQIPLSLTIAQLLLAQAGNRSYALLTDGIEQILIPQSHQIRCWEGGKVIRWGKDAHEQLIAVYRLSEVLNYCSLLPDALPSPSQYPVAAEGQQFPIILIRCQERLLGLEVDQLLGEQELVIRPLGEMIVPPAYVYGGSILADGRLTLVIDGAVLMQYAIAQRAVPEAIAQQTDDTLVTLPFRKPDRNALPQLPHATSHLLPSSRTQRQLPTGARAALPGTPDPDFPAKPGKMILLVDDSITLRQTLALTLQKAGYQVLQAKDGYEAIEQLRHQANNIGLVICDIEMPRMNGFEFLKHRQQDPTLVNIPTIILTSRSGEKHRLIASELGATDYITKPFIEHNLLTRVTVVLEKSSLNSSSR
jgi:chemotaxis protein histidine kinase CheA/ActR/RegA family two-component response regulator